MKAFKPPNELPRKASAVIIGAGVTGLGTAYQLAKRGVADVVVVDKSYLNSGATGRNGGGIRAQWTTEENVELCARSIRMFKDLGAEIGHNFWFRQGGYLMLARSERSLQGLQKAVNFQREHGLRTRVISPSEARDVMPDLDVRANGVVGASYNPDDAVLFPWPCVYGYAERLAEMGGTTATFTAVNGIETRAGTVHAVRTSRGTIETPVVINAAGAWAKEVGAMVSVDLPIEAEKHEIMVTEPLKPFFDCMLVDLATGLYCNQTSRGEVVGGISGKHHERTLSWDSSLDFMLEYAKTLTTLVPRLKPVKALRQWAGSYDVTEDAKPILERHASPEGFITAAGFSGHGFMTHPMTNLIVASLVLNEKPPMDIRPFRASRFAEGDLRKEALVIG